MAGARVLMAGVRLGLFQAVASEAKSAQTLAAECDLDEGAAVPLLDCLAALGYVRKSRAGLYRLAERQRPWLDAGSPKYIGDFLEFNYDQWNWWSQLEQRARTGTAFDIHSAAEDDAHWRRYMMAMYQLARLAAPEVARRVRLPARPQRLLDVAGGHGWYAAEMCRRHPALRATVLDLSSSARVGREIIAGAGMADRVEHREGDMLTSALDGPYDGALCFQIVHHLDASRNAELFARIAFALRTGGTIAVLDYFNPPPGRRPDESAFLGLHFFLTSAASTYTAANVAEWMREAGFGPVRRCRLLHVPMMTLLQARKQ